MYLHVKIYDFYKDLLLILGLNRIRIIPFKRLLL